MTDFYISVNQDDHNSSPYYADSDSGTGISMIICWFSSIICVTLIGYTYSDDPKTSGMAFCGLIAVCLCCGGCIDQLNKKAEPGYRTGAAEPVDTSSKNTVRTRSNSV